MKQDASCDYEQTRFQNISWWYKYTINDILSLLKIPYFDDIRINLCSVRENCKVYATKYSYDKPIIPSVKAKENKIVLPAKTKNKTSDMFP